MRDEVNRTKLKGKAKRTADLAILTLNENRKGEKLKRPKYLDCNL